MESEMKKIATDPAKLHGMTKEQSKCEVQYKMAQKMLDILLRRGIVTEEERKKIDEWLLKNSHKSNDEIQQEALEFSLRKK